jgi:hypothetical protein
MKQAGLSLTIAAVFLASCSGGGGGNSPPPPPTTGAIRLLNQTSYSIHEVYVSPSSAETWGSNRTSGAIPPSYSLTVSGLSPNYWDVEAVTVGAQSPYFAFGFEFPVVAGETYDVYALNSNFSGSLKVINGDTTYSLTGLYVVPPSWETWGDNQLLTTVPPTGSYLLYGVPAGTWDVRCDHSDGGYSTGTWDIASYSVTTITCY